MFIKTTTGVLSQNYYEWLNLFVCNEAHFFQMPPTGPFIFLRLEKKNQQCVKKPSFASMTSYNCQLNFKNCHIDIILAEVEIELSRNVSLPARNRTQSQSHLFLIIKGNVPLLEHDFRFISSSTVNNSLMK